MPFGWPMLLEQQEKNTYQDNIKLIFAWIQNPSCSIIFNDFTQLHSTKHSLWKPRQRFTDWACKKENLQQGFATYFQNTQLSLTNGEEQTLEGSYTLHPVIPFSTPFATLQIRPDATIIHNNQKRIIEVCCQPDRKGNTNRYALQKSRLRAAICSYAINPQNPSPYAFIVLHRWSHIMVHEQNIEQELQHVHEALNTKTHTPYHFTPSCHWFCLHSKQCQEKAQKEGAPIAWSLSLQNIVHNDVWSAKKDLSQPTPSSLHTIAHFYKKAFSEES